MNITDAVDYVGKRFTYKTERISLFDWWFVMREFDGRMYGDCDDFSVTAIWIACNRNPWIFFWRVLVLHQYRIYFCKTMNGGKHAVGYAEGKYFDNWTRQALDEEVFFRRTGHKKIFFIPGPLFAFNMLLGMFLRNSNNKDS